MLSYDTYWTKLMCYQTNYHLFAIKLMCYQKNYHLFAIKLMCYQIFLFASDFLFQAHVLSNKLPSICYQAHVLSNKLLSICYQAHVLSIFFNCKWFSIPSSYAIEQITIYLLSSSCAIHSIYILNLIKKSMLSILIAYIFLCTTSSYRRCIQNFS